MAFFGIRTPAPFTTNFLECEPATHIDFAASIVANGSDPHLIVNAEVTRVCSRRADEDVAWTGSPVPESGARCCRGRRDRLAG
jgi:hypothetical protein